jgi:hypothetical protein
MAIDAHGGARGLREGASVDEPSELGLLFHRLNNQLGIILANAELLEAKLADEAQRARESCRRAPSMRSRRRRSFAPSSGL